MAGSPLTQDARPSFQPKIVSLYESLFKDEDEPERSEGFWTEFFLLRPYPPGLVAQIEPLSPDDLLHSQSVTRKLFGRSVAAFKAGKSPQDEIALDTLQVFLREVFNKRFTNLSSDIISLLTGLDHVDAVFTDFVAALEMCIRNGKNLETRRKAIQVALGISCGAFNTGLLSYFAHRDLFPALTKFINDPETTGMTFEPFVLLGVLANYNKFEFQNPYQLRLDDFVNEATILRIVHEVGMSCISCRAEYVAILDDLPEGWSLNSMLSYVGLTILAGARPKTKTPPPSGNYGDMSKLNFSMLPNTKAAILLATYDFINANKLFCHHFVNYQETDPKVEPPICSFLSLTSYLLQHAHRSARSSLYARLNLLVLRILLEEQTICKRLVTEETIGFVRLCRQKPPHLPIVRGKRILLSAVIDALADGINHNLRKKLDVELYISLIGVLMRCISFLIRTRTRLVYHWTELWRCLLTLTRFMASYAAELKEIPRVMILVDDAVNLIALSLSSGDSFLPGAAEYDDLFYKLVEAGDVLVKFRDSYDLATQRTSTNAIATLISVSEHYYQLIEENRGKSGKKNLTPQQVADVIKSGYETLSMEGLEGAGRSGGGGGLDRWERYREADERAFLKKVARAVVVDVKTVEDGNSPLAVGGS